MLNSEGEETKPSAVEIDGEVDKDNILTYKVSISSKGNVFPQETLNESKNQETVTILFSDWSKGFNSDLTSGLGDLSDKQKELKEKQEARESLQTEIENGVSVSENIKEIKKLDKEIKKLEKEIKSIENSQLTVKVVTFFSKNKSGSKQTVEFIYNGSTLSNGTS